MNLETLPRRPWSYNEWAALGKVSDERIARRTGRTVAEVRAERKRLEQFDSMPKLRHPPGYVSSPRAWTVAECVALAAMPPGRAAKVLGRRLSLVLRMRELLGLESGREMVWTDKTLRLLGTMPDAELGRRLGVDSGTVLDLRTQLGINRYVWSAQWTPETIALLGTVSDRALASRLGVPAYHVAWKRRQLNVERYNPPKGWPAASIALLGTMSDDQVARRLGITQSTVAMRRRKLGITAFRPRRK